MGCDVLLQLSSKQPLETGEQASAPRPVATYDPSWPNQPGVRIDRVRFKVSERFEGEGSYVTFAIQHSSTEKGCYTFIGESRKCPTTMLDVNWHWDLVLPAGCLGFIRAYYTVEGTLTSGAIDACIIKPAD